MLFSPQKELDSSYFAKLLLLMAVLHCAALTFLFIAEYLAQSKPFVMSMGSGARVRMFPGNGARGAQRPSGPATSASSQARSTQPTQNTAQQPMPAPIIPSVKQEQKKEPKKSEAKQEPEKSVRKKETAIPGFSPIKKKEKAVPESSPLKKEKKNAAEQKIMSVDGYSKLEKKSEPAPKQELATAKSPDKASGPITPSPSQAPVHPDRSGGGHGDIQSSGQQNYSGSGSAGAYTGPVETVEIYGDEPGWSDNEYSREFFRFYAEPPGFKDRDSFTISFDIKDGKACNVSPRGNEPVALYTQAKAAILNMTFARISYAKRVSFII